MDVYYIIPCYKSEHTLQAIIAEIATTMQATRNTYEVVLVNDCSPDNTWAVINELCAVYPNITGINFAKNAGQHAALMAGFRVACGEVVVCLDDDGQTPPSEAPKLLAAIQNGADAAYACYPAKKHSAFRNWGSRINDLMTRWLLSKPKDLFVSSYFAVRRFVVEEIKRYDNPYPYIIGLVLRATSNIVNVDIQHKVRLQGASGYTLGKLFSLWLNGFTSFSVKPLRAASLLGAFVSIIGLVAAIVVIINKLLHPEVPMGWSSTICVLLFVGGMLMLMLGLVGEYVGRLYISANKSPQYVVRETIGGKPEAKK